MTSCLVVLNSVNINTLQWPCAGAPIRTGAVASYPIYALFIRHVFCLNLLDNFSNDLLPCRFEFCLISIACNGHVPVHPLAPTAVASYPIYALFIRLVFCLNLLYNFSNDLLPCRFEFCLMSIACNGHVPVHPLGQVPLQVIQYIYLSDMFFA